MSFKSGDRVVVIFAPNKPENLGAVVTILDGPMPFRSSRARRCVSSGDPVYTLDLPTDPGFSCVVARPEWLELYRPDHAEKIAWSELPEWLRIEREEQV